MPKSIVALMLVGAVAVQAQPAVNLLFVGDWGRHGEHGQRDVAKAMGLEAARLDAHGVVALGDNFYPDGVSSTLDPQWVSSFEAIYTAHSLHCPWYVVLGNHDYHGNVQAQIDYDTVSQRWTCPARYYTQTITEDEDGDEVSVLLVVIDTSPFQSSYYDNPSHYSDATKQDTARQMRWLDSVLRTARADWVIVAGHHPMYTGGKRKGSPSDIEKRFKSVFEKYKVAAYVAGHEHDLQYHDDGSGIAYIVSGAGSELRETGTMEYTKFAQSVNGFVTMTALPRELRIRFVGVDGKELYSVTRAR